jgi:hypothetical protein
MDVGSTGVDCVDFGWIDVEAKDAATTSCELQA